MKKKFSVIIPLSVIAIAFIFVIFYNRNEDFGLSNDAINAEKQLSAEETIRLYFYSNRQDDSVSNILDDSLVYDDLPLSSVSLVDKSYTSRRIVN